MTNQARDIFTGIFMVAFFSFFLVQYINIFGTIKVVDCSPAHFVVASVLMAGFSMGMFLVVCKGTK